MARTVFMIRNSKGLYSCGSTWPSFSNTGKVWTSSKSFGGHLALFNIENLEKFYGGCEFLSFNLDTPSTVQNVDGHIRRVKIKTAMMDKHKDASLSNFIDMLDKKDLGEKFKWIVYIKHDNVMAYSYKIAEEALDLIKSLGIKKANFRTSFCAFAFANKADAATFRLSMPGDIVVYEMGTLMETIL